MTAARSQLKKRHRKVSQHLEIIPSRLFHFDSLIKRDIIYIYITLVYEGCQRVKFSHISKMYLDQKQLVMYLEYLFCVKLLFVDFVDSMGGY